MRKTHVSPRRSAAEWSKLVAAWKLSGQSAAEFAKSRSISANTLAWWKWRLSTEKASTGPLALVPVEVVREDEEIPELEWELQTTAGHVLRARGSGAVEALAVVVNALGLREESRP